MKRYCYKFIILLSLFAYSISLSACTINTATPVYNPQPTLTTSRSANSSNDISPSADLGSSESLISPTPAPANSEMSLYVRGQNISLGENTDSLIQKLGSPTRIDTSEYDFDYYIYNNDYTRLTFIAVSNNKVIGFYSDSLDFNFKGIYYGCDLRTVNKALKITFTLDQILYTKESGNIIKVLMDTVDSKEVTGIYVLPSKVKKQDYSENVMKCLEQRVYDLTNSIRARNNVSLLAWSSSAALSARKHCFDMAENDYFDQVSLLGQSLQERLSCEGIYFTDCAENIIAGYESAIMSTHRWFNSKNHRNNILDSSYRYVGAGFAYDSKSNYKTYLVEDFYR